MVYRLEKLPCHQLPRGEEVLDCGHIPSHGAEFLQEVINLLFGLSHGPPTENCQQILLVLAARLRRAKRGVVLQVRAADHIAHTRPGILAHSALQTRADPAIFGFYQGAFPPAGGATELVKAKDGWV